MKIIQILFLSLMLFSSCYYDNMGEIHPKVPATLSSASGSCDSLNITYTNHIKKIMDNYCVGCHSASNAGGGVALDTYTAVSNSASGSLYNSVNWTGGVSQMPKGSASKISDCSLKQIKIWIDSGKAQ